MIIKSLAELAQSDDRGLNFTPFGLGPKMDPEAAAEFQQKLIASLDLPEQVPETTRESFDRLRTIHSYGILCYDLYTVAAEQAHLVVEQALRDRFLSFYSGVVNFNDGQGQLQVVTASSFGDLYQAVRKDDGRLRGWELNLRSGDKLHKFDGNLSSLLRWARAEHLLGGQRDRVGDRYRVLLRNAAAHPRYQLLDPGFSVQAITRLAELISRLWGAAPGIPVRREVMVIAWTDQAALCDQASLYQPRKEVPATAPHVVVRADPGDPDLLQFDAQYETTVRPCDYLWGPGTWPEAAAWLDREQPTGDHVTTVDRLFLLRYHDMRLYLPRNTAVAADLDQDQRAGTWYLLRADSPIDAFSHQRQALAGVSGHKLAGLCDCPVETLSGGTWREAICRSAAAGADVTPRKVPDTRVQISSAPRWNEILGDGQWTVRVT